MPQKHVIPNVCESKKLGSHCTTKDSTKLEYQHDLTYFTQGTELNCNETCLGGIARRLQERVLEDSGKDIKSNMVKQSMDISHPPVCMKDFQILTKGFKPLQI